MTMASAFPRKVGERLQAARAEHAVEPFHDEGVHLHPFGKRQLAELIVNGGRQIRPSVGSSRCAGAQRPSERARRREESGMSGTTTPDKTVLRGFGISLSLRRQLFVDPAPKLADLVRGGAGEFVT